VRLRAFGTYDFRIVDPPKFLKEGRAPTCTSASTSSRTSCGPVWSACSAKRWPRAKWPALDIATRYQRARRSIAAADQSGAEREIRSRDGSFIIENVSVPPEVEKASDRKRSSMAAVGNLNDYVKYQMAQGLEKGGSGVAGVGAEMAVGMAVAQQMPQSAGRDCCPRRRRLRALRRRRLPACPRLLSPADAARALGVSESDVIASLDSGDLKGKKIGTQWRSRGRSSRSSCNSGQRHLVSVVTAKVTCR